MQPLITIIGTISSGVFCIILADRIKLPSILFLVLAGLFLGPFGLNLIQPSVFKEQLPQYISLLVALILFEGGTYLRFEQLKEISGPLRNLLTIGPFITLILATISAHAILGMSWAKSVLFGAILIVTGPTVVQPILQRIRINEKVYNLLKWESILIDPLGVIIAIVLSEILLVDSIGPLEGFGLLAARILIGTVLGFLAGEALFFCLSRSSLLRFESEELSGVFVLAVVLLFYGISEAALSESGIVTVTAAGIIFGNKKLNHIENILRFKKQLTLIALSTIFILLSANIPLPRIREVMPEGTLFLAFLIFVVRPAAVLCSSMKEAALTGPERLFLCFFAPRGIVSAVLASLFTIMFEEKNLIGKGLFLPLAFYVIIGSIIFYSSTSWLLARLLKITETERRSVLIVGANTLGLIFGKTIRDHNFPVIFIDTNPELCEKAASEGFEVHCGNAADRNFIELIDLKGVNQMIAVTPNHEANVLCCQLMSGYLGRKSVFRLWDKTDSWKNLDSQSFHESGGQPLVLTSSRREVLPKTEISKVKLTAPLTLTKELCASGKDESRAMFGLFKNKLQMAAANCNFPAETTVIFLKENS